MAASRGTTWRIITSHSNTRSCRYDPDLLLIGILPWNDWDLSKEDWIAKRNGLPGALRRQELFVDADGRVRLKNADVLQIRSTRFNFLPERVKWFLRAHSHLYHFLGERLRKSSKRGFWRKAEGAELTEEQEQQNWLKGLALLEAIVQRVRAAQATPLGVMLIPHLYESHSDILIPQFTYWPSQDTGRLLLQWLGKRKVPVLNLVRLLDPHDEKRLYLRYDKHFTPLGNRLAAQALIPFLRNHRLLPAQGAAGKENVFQEGSRK